MRKVSGYLFVGFVSVLLISGSAFAGKRTAKARISDGDVKGSVVIGTIPEGWNVMAYIRGIVSPGDAAVCLEPTSTAGDGSCTVLVCAALPGEVLCGADTYGNLEISNQLTGQDFIHWPGGAGQNFLDDLDDGEVSAVVYHDVDDGVSAGVFVVVFP